MRITPQMILEKKFSYKPRGYDTEEVDEYLDAICDELDSLHAEINSLQQQLTAARAARPEAEAPTQQVRPVLQKTEPAPAPAPAPAAAVPTEAFREILEMAQKVKDQTIEAAKVKAEEIVAKAEEEARAKLGGLAEEKEQLTSQVEALKAAASDYRAKFETLLQAQQEAIEKAADLF